MIDTGQGVSILAVAQCGCLMNGRERTLSHLDGRPVDRLPVMPITMQFACDLIGARYHDYETDHRVLVAAQMRVAEQFDFDYVNSMSDPGREAADCGAILEYFENSPAALVEQQALLENKNRLMELAVPDPLGGGRMHNGVEAIALFKEKLRGGTVEEVHKSVGECHQQAGDRYIVGAGCEIPRDTPHENVRAFAEYAREQGPPQAETLSPIGQSGSR